jgi:tetratricopeptide (TPR) repeat protein
MDYHKIALPLLLLFTLCLVSCSDNQAVRLRYEAEKLYYRADRQMKDANLAPDRSRAQVKLEAADAYGKALEFSLEALDSISIERNPVEQREVRYLAYQSANRLASLFFQARRFDTCVTILSGLLAKASYEGAAHVTTTISLGRALQASDQWDSALTVYQAALDYHFPPVDDSGEVIDVLFKLPLHIFQIVRAVGDSGAASIRYRRAEEYYRSIVELDPPSDPAQAAHTALARLYHETAEWRKVIDELRLLEEKAEDPLEIRINIADIYSRMPNGNDSAVALYQSLLAELQPADSAYRPRLRFKIALMKMEKGRYREARELLIDIKRDYPRFYAGTPLVQFSIARSFELLDRWSRAETEYKYLIEKYRGSEQAMAAYLHLGDQYRKLGREEEAQQRYREAEDYYDEMIERGAGTLIEARALAFKADLYRRWDNYDESARLLVAMFEKFPQTLPGRSSLVKAAGLYRDRLGQPQRADSLMARLRSMLLEPEEGWGT